MTAAVLTWNAGASKPSWLQHSIDDSNFFRDYITSHEPPDIFVFGFQELVDLEDKKVTAKSFFKSKAVVRHATLEGIAYSAGKNATHARA